MERMATRGFGAKKIAAALGHFFILSLPRIWLSRSTSKIDALDDDETPLRWTASQTATKRGVMVSGIMGALDIAPTLHFVEPCLKTSSEEWIKVMDEYIVPNCAALTERGVSFYCSSHASGLACGALQDNVARHGRVSTTVLSRPLSPLDFFLWNVLNNTARSASSSCQLRRIAGTYDPRVSQNVGRQP